MGSVRLVILLLMVSVVGGGYFYISILNKNLQVAYANQAKLESAVEQQTATITKLEEDYARASEELQRVNEDFAATRAQNNLLSERLRDVDLGLLARAKPKSIERAINNGTSNANRCFEILSGAMLTDRERKATTGEEFNKECPWLWPGLNATE